MAKTGLSRINSILFLTSPIRSDRTVSSDWWQSDSTKTATKLPPYSRLLKSPITNVPSSTGRNGIFPNSEKSAASNSTSQATAITVMGSACTIGQPKRGIFYIAALKDFSIFCNQSRTNSKLRVGNIGIFCCQSSCFYHFIFVSNCHGFLDLS